MRLPIVLCVLLAACTVSPADSTVSQTSAPAETTSAPTTTEFVAPLTDCPRPPYQVAELPGRVSADAVEATEVAEDSFTSMPGTHSTIWLDEDGKLAVALIRGSLPPEEWPGDKGSVFIDGVEAVAGQYADGTWVVGWFEAPGERCDLYTMVFYQPVEPSEVQAALASMNRVAG